MNYGLQCVVIIVIVIVIVIIKMIIILRVIVIVIILVLHEITCQPTNDNLPCHAMPTLTPFLIPYTPIK